MEPRDPSRTAPTAEAPTLGTPAAPRPIARWIARARDHCPTPGRLALLVLATATVLALAVAAIGWASRSAVAWLARQPAYRRHFRQIELDPPPPGFLRPGAAGLLEQVRTAARWPEEEPLPLDLDLAEIARLFRNYCPWVADVVQVRRSHHNRLTVHLTYRQPILYLATDQTPRVYLDRALVALPPEDVDPGRAGPLIRLVGLDGPVHFLPGSTFETTAPGATAKLAASLKIATYLFDQMSRDPSTVRVNLINPQWGPHLVEVQTTDRLWVLWGHAPGAERRGEPSAPEKWSNLHAWIASHGAKPPPRSAKSGASDWYLDLTGPEPTLRKSLDRNDSPQAP